MNRQTDRLKEALFALVRAAVPTVDYQALYRARVVKQAGNTVDVLPDDKRLPGMSGIEIRHGIPGAQVTVAPGAYVLVGWDAGDPARPYAALWESATVINLTLNAARIDLAAACTPVVDGVLTGQAIDPLTSMPHWMLGNSSLKVSAK